VALESDQFQRPGSPVQPGGRFGVPRVRDAKTAFDVELGASEDREYFSTGLDRSFTESWWARSSYTKVNASTSIHEQATLFPNVTSGGNYRINFDLAAVTAIRKWFGWQFTVSDRYLSNPDCGAQGTTILLFRRGCGSRCLVRRRRSREEEFRSQNPEVRMQVRASRGCSGF